MIPTATLVTTSVKTLKETVAQSIYYLINITPNITGRSSRNERDMHSSILILSYINRVIDTLSGCIMFKFEALTCFRNNLFFRA